MKDLILKRMATVLLLPICFAAVSCGRSERPLDHAADVTDRKPQSQTESAARQPLETVHRAYAYSVFDSAKQGETVSVKLSGCNPGERAVCRMKTPSGWANAKGLGLGVADEDGSIVWEWRISPVANLGEGFFVYLICEDGSLIAKFPFFVTEAEPEAGTDGESGGETETEPETADETGSGVSSAVYRTVTLEGGMTVTVFYEAERGSVVTLRLTGGVAGATYTCRMISKSGESDAAGLGEAVADANGEVTWTWRIGARLVTDFEPTVEVSGMGLTEPFCFSFTVFP